jgi:hypothetical protein
MFTTLFSSITAYVWHGSSAEQPSAGAAEIKNVENNTNKIPPKTVLIFITAPLS